MVNFGFSSLGRSTFKFTANQDQPLPLSHEEDHNSQPKSRPTHFRPTPHSGYIPEIPPRSGSFPQIHLQSSDEKDPFARRSSGQADPIYDQEAHNPPTPTSSRRSRESQARRSPKAQTPGKRNHHRREYSVSSLDRQIIDSSRSLHRHPHPSERQQSKESRQRTISKPVKPIISDSGSHSHPSYPSHPYSSRNDFNATSASSLHYAPRSSPEQSSTDLPNLLPPRRIPTMRPSPLNPHATPGESGYETSSSAPDSIRRTIRGRHVPTHDVLSEMPEMAEANDTLGGLPNDSPVPGVLALGMGFTNGNYSSASVGNKVKADKVLGLDPNAKLASFYLVSGLPRVNVTTSRQPWG